MTKYWIIGIAVASLMSITCRTGKAAARPFVKAEVASSPGVKQASIRLAISVNRGLDNETDKLTPEIIRNIYELITDPIKTLNANLEQDYGIKTNLGQILRDKPTPKYEIVQGNFPAHVLRIGETPASAETYIAVELGLFMTRLAPSDFRIWCGAVYREVLSENPRTGILYSATSIKKEASLAWLSNLSKMTSSGDSLLNRALKDYPDFEGDLKEMNAKTFYQAFFFVRPEKKQKDLAKYAYATACNSEPLLK